jgi:protocatechuate 3,4-dioxygenase, alpha subunit
MSDTLPLTPSQTVGPFPHEAWQWAVVASAPTGTPALRIQGRLLDGDGAPVNDGWVEAWAPGAIASLLQGFSRVPTDEQGGFTIDVAARPPRGEPAAYVMVFARGLVLHQCTAVFIDDGPGLLEQVPAQRRASLMAQPRGGGVYRWDIRLQGDASAETVFFDYG